ncbi:MAG: chloride channel protein EriC [Acidimicrobiia bacterium]|nr:chloride channel protein EriC [Acidimicrobiia bacterium]
MSYEGVMRGTGRLLAMAPILLVIGAVVGAVVAGLDWIVFTVLLGHLYDKNVWLLAVCPLVGLVICLVVLRWAALGASPSTTDEYLFVVSTPGDVLDPYPAPARAVATIAAVGSGAALGLEGGALYLGGALAVAMSRLLNRLRLDPTVMVVVGGAAGLAALFQQPLFGALFAVEAPYRMGLDVRRLPAALLGGIGGWAAFALLLPQRGGIVDIGPSFHFQGKMLLVAVLAGVGGALVARVFGPLVLGARRVLAAVVPGPRLLACGVILALVVLLGDKITSYGGGTTLGPGTFGLSWAVSPEIHATATAVVGLLILRLIATPAAVAGGGAGGIIVPLFVCGGLVGRLIADVVDDRYWLLAAVLGGAAAVAAGYRVPLAMVAFTVATLASVWGLVLGVLAVGAATAASAGVSVSPAQGLQPPLVRVPASRRSRPGGRARRPAEEAE